MYIHNLLMDGSSATPSPLPPPCIVHTFGNHTNEIHALSIQFDPTHHFNDLLICSYSNYNGSKWGSISGSYKLNLETQMTLLTTLKVSIIQDV